MIIRAARVTGRSLPRHEPTFAEFASLTAEDIQLFKAQHSHQLAQRSGLSVDELDISPGSVGSMSEITGS